MSDKVQFPIRMILGGADGFTETAITVVYETPNGKADAASCSAQNDFSFVENNEPSEIVFYRVKGSKETFDADKDDWRLRDRNAWKILKVRIRRDWQFKS